MKILVSLTYYYPHWTGLTAYALRLAEGLAKRGHQLTVLTSQYKKELARTEMHNGVRIVRLPTALHLSRGVVMPAFLPTLYRLAREHDLLQVHTPMLETNLVTRVGLMRGKPTVLTHHGDLVMPQNSRDQFIERAMTALMVQGEREATRITVHSCDYADHSKFLSPFRAKLDCIYPPVEIPEPNLEQVAQWRAELGLTQNKLVGFAGRFVEEKGFDYLLQAIPFVRAKIPDVKFVYAGEINVVYERFFDRWKHLVEQERESIVTLGLLLDPQRLANFYALNDVFALPSRTDCFPSVQIEAMLSGTPVVATNIPGAREVVRVTGMGKLVAPRDPRALAEGLIEVLTNRHAYMKTRAQIREIFNTEKTLDEYEKLFETLVNTQ
ncbi:MAG: GDP-mannose-dependent alpha-(1-6)-phosphatidylinositol monomannoside mannosyltransferase [Anaerolineae bacterium]|nr:GDP-mannose-dependent alpha-(1-6)-phosphatidylinositol monomannoside mannosyltransferase [Anaerolineae bacterium]